MYPMVCHAGYPIPIKKGRFTVVGVSATINDTAATARLTLIDSEAFKEVSDDQAMKPTICDLKSVSAEYPVLLQMFPEPIKVRNGVSIGSNTKNLIPGKTLIYIQ